MSLTCICQAMGGSLLSSRAGQNVDPSQSGQPVKNPGKSLIYEGTETGNEWVRVLGEGPGESEEKTRDKTVPSLGECFLAYEGSFFF